jgi:hypothetical protein
MVGGLKKARTDHVCLIRGTHPGLPAHPKGGRFSLPKIREGFGGLPYYLGGAASLPYAVGTKKFVIYVKIRGT